MSTKAFFPCGGGSNLILGTGMANQIFILITSTAINFFHQILKNCHFGVNKKNHSSPIWICMTHIWSPTLFPGADPGGPRGLGPLTTKNEAPAPKSYKTEAPEWQF